MLKAVTPDEMRTIESLAVEAGISSETLMETAGKEIAALISSYSKERAYTLTACVVAGTGNNGGDGYVIARYLLQEGFSVHVAQIGVLDPQSLVKKQRRRFEARGGKVIDLNNTPLTLPKDGIVIDAIFGTGFRGTQKESTLQCISTINASSCTIFAVDVPSGLNSTTGEVAQLAVEADITYTVEYPKTGFFIGDGWNHVGQVVSVPIGLAAFATKMDCSLVVLEKSDVVPLVPKVIRTRNKYNRGHVVALAGSHGYAGAALLSATSALHSGAGIVHLLHPQDCSLEFIGDPREIIRVGYSFEALEPVKSFIDKATACFVGPGLGLGAKQQAMLGTLWPNFQKKIVIDADALNWLATTKGTAFGPIPNAILTPHLGELRRFLQGKEPLSLDLIKKCQQLVEDNQTNILLKGGPSILFSHGKTPIVVMQGTPGMATAGSGDVLTGILSSLLSQGLSCEDAMKLGSFIHGRAGELAAEEETTHCMTASSITNHLAHVFKELHN